MERAVAAGKVRSIGISNFESDRLEELCKAATIKPSVLQVECHPFYQQRALKERVAKYGTAIECWYPLGHADAGLLVDRTLRRPRPARRSHRLLQPVRRAPAVHARV